MCAFSSAADQAQPYMALHACSLNVLFIVVTVIVGGSSSSFCSFCHFAMQLIWVLAAFAPALQVSASAFNMSLQHAMQVG
jgi:hypothetical protein